MSAPIQVESASYISYNGPMSTQKGSPHVDSSPINGLSLFTGIGGIELGLQAALGPRYVTKCYVEREAATIAILRERMRNERLHQGPLWTDVQSFDCNPWRGHIDIISAGIPCQPWSIAGRRKGHEDERHMWEPTKRIIEDLSPSYVFLENVPGMAKQGLEPIWRDLRSMGYEVEAGIFSAAEVGARHIRKRLFVLAHANSLNILHSEARVRNKTRNNPLQSPGNGETWIIRSPWEIEPAICRVADGVPNRMDRLRALGNAVVPQTAAYAFTTLLKEANR